MVVTGDEERDYIDSEMDTAAQAIRHFLEGQGIDMVDQRIIELMRDSLKRLETEL